MLQFNKASRKILKIMYRYSLSRIKFLSIVVIGNNGGFCSFQPFDIAIWFVSRFAEQTKVVRIRISDHCLDITLQWVSLTTMGTTTPVDTKMKFAQIPSVAPVKLNFISRFSPMQRRNRVTSASPWDVFLRACMHALSTNPRMERQS